jgi:hypothetical protein
MFTFWIDKSSAFLLKSLTETESHTHEPISFLKILEFFLCGVKLPVIHKSMSLELSPQKWHNSIYTVNVHWLLNSWHSITQYIIGVLRDTSLIASVIWHLQILTQSVMNCLYVRMYTLSTDICSYNLERYLL